MAGSPQGNGGTGNGPGRRDPELFQNQLRSDAKEKRGALTKTRQDGNNRERHNLQNKPRPSKATVGRTVTESPSLATCAPRNTASSSGPQARKRGGHGTPRGEKPPRRPGSSQTASVTRGRGEGSRQARHRHPHHPETSTGTSRLEGQCGGTLTCHRGTNGRKEQTLTQSTNSEGPDSGAAASLERGAQLRVLGRELQRRGGHAEDLKSWTPTCPGQQLSLKALHTQ